MLSRVADSVYWMARYLERVENLARFIEVTLSFSLDQPESGIEQWEPLVRSTGDEDLFVEQYGDFTATSVKRFLTFDRDYPGSMLTAVSLARENARTIREALSSEAWEELNALYHFVNDASKSEFLDRDAEFYDRIVNHCYLFTGILNSMMTRSTAWHFANMGRYHERADKTSRILDVKYFTLLRRIEDVNTPFDDLLWSAVLRSACGFEMFRKRHHAITVPRIVRFLVLDDRFPRAIRFCLEEFRRSLLAVGAPVPAAENESLEQVSAIITMLDAADPEDIINQGLHEFIDQLQSALNRLGSHIARTYFSERPFPAEQHQEQ